MAKFVAGSCDARGQRGDADYLINVDHIVYITAPSEHSPSFRVHLSIIDPETKTSKVLSIQAKQYDAFMSALEESPAP